MSDNNQRIVKIEGHPILQIGTKSIAIKEEEYMRFREFKYSNIRYLKVYRPYETFYKIFFFAERVFYDSFRKKDSYSLKVKLNNGDYWNFEIQTPVNRDFLKEVRLLSVKVNKIVIKINA